jgi:Xaa-Pro aminopeptidase
MWICRTGVVGTLEDQTSRFRRFAEAVQRAMAQIGPEQSGEQIFTALKDELSREGFEPAGSAFGNGVGIGENIERPGIHLGETMETRPGMVLSIEPIVSIGFKTNLEIIIRDTGNKRIETKALPVDDLLTISA